MIKKMFFAAVAAVAMMGCNEKSVYTLDMRGGEKVQLTVTLPKNLTKVTGTPADAQVNDIQIFVFDKNGLYEASSNAQGTSLSMTCTTGEKRIVALVNAPLETDIANIDQLKSRTSDLSDCRADNIVMVGEMTEVLTASTTLTMQVSRIAAKVSIAQVTTDFELDAHKELPFEVTAIYLINVAGDKAYFTDSTPTVWYNKAKYIEQSSPAFLYDAVTSGQILNGESYDTEHFFYCYPNSTSTKTRMVIEAEIGGYKYYYPVTLNNVNANTAYTYNLTITRLGSYSPDEPVAEGTVTFSVVVKDWVEQGVQETI